MQTTMSTSDMTANYYPSATSSDWVQSQNTTVPLGFHATPRTLFLGGVLVAVVLVRVPAPASCASWCRASIWRSICRGPQSGIRGVSPLPSTTHSRLVRVIENVSNHLSTCLVRDASDRQLPVTTDEQGKKPTHLCQCDGTGPVRSPVQCCTPSYVGLMMYVSAFVCVWSRLVPHQHLMFSLGESKSTLGSQSI